MSSTKVYWRELPNYDQRMRQFWDDDESIVRLRNFFENLQAVTGEFVVEGSIKFVPSEESRPLANHPVKSG